MNYSFRNKRSKRVVTLEMSMADREVYLKEHPNMEQVLLTMPPLLDPFFMGRLNDSAKSFQKNVLGKMKETIPGNNLKESKFAQNILEI